MSDTTNTSFLFLPFSFGKRENFLPLTAALEAGPDWEATPHRVRYMLRYVTDKLDMRREDGCLCRRYRLRDSGRAAGGLGTAEDWFWMKGHRYEQETEPFRFRIENVWLYAFRTSVGILAFQLSFGKDDPYWLANAQYHLKKVSKEPVAREEDGPATTLLAMGQALLKALAPELPTEFFPFANPGTERANLFTYVEAGPDVDLPRALFYLRRCYSPGYTYTEDPERDRTEILSPGPETAWGLSPEAAVCVTRPELGNSGFIRRTFARNVREEYLFMYVLLLHQKYVLYHFLTRLGVGSGNDLDRLEEYRQELYEFETDFVFTRITEVPQYQNLYERLLKVFALREMYEDVHEPIRSLGEVRRETREKDRKRRDDLVNTALLFLSVLSLFSALVDSFDFFDHFLGLFLSRPFVLAVQIVGVAGIMTVSVIVLVKLIRARK